MNSSFRVCLWVLLCLTLAAPAAVAQDDLSSTPPSPVTPPPAHLSFVDGTAMIDRDGERNAAAAGSPLMAGDRIRTEAGRVEILFPDGSALHLDESTTVDLLAGDLIRLTEGRVSLHAAGAGDPSRVVRYQIDAPAASVQINDPGQYRMAAVSGEVDLSVITGAATFATDLGSVTVRAGEQASAREGQAPSAPQYFNSARWDSFDRWSVMRRDARLGTASAEYLPQDLHAYSGTFDRYGTWREEPEVGNVWYPAVAADWRPYSNGYWQPYREWGSVWIGADAWGYATHHYGRWGFSSSFGWYWAPTSEWGPAWVYWGSAPGYVSWCPLGRYGDPVFGLWGARGSYYGSHVDPWRGWTVIPHHAFGRAVSVARSAVDGRRLPPDVRRGFATHRSSPRTGVAVPRSWAGRQTGFKSDSQHPRGSGGDNTIRNSTRDDSREGSTGIGTPRRYGRGDGTGVARPLDPAASDLNDQSSRARRSVPGSADRVIPNQPTPRAAVGMPGRRTISQDGRDRAFTNPTPSEVVGSRPTPSQAVGMHPRRDLPATSPRTYEPSRPSPRTYEPRAYQPPASAPRTYEPSRPSPRTNEPRAYQPPASAPRTYEPRAYQPPASAPRTNEPRAYQPPASAPRTNGTDGSTRQSAPAPRFNPGTAAPRGGASHGASSRQRSSRNQ